MRKRSVISGVLLLLFVLALGIGLFVVRQSQDTRQQAAGESPEDICPGGLLSACSIPEFADVVAVEHTSSFYFDQIQNGSLGSEERARLLAALLYEKWRNNESPQSSPADSEQVVQLALFQYHHIRTQYPLYIGEYDLSREWFFDYMAHTWGSLMSENGQNNPNLLSLIRQDPRFSQLEAVSLALDPSVPYYFSQHEVAYAQLQALDNGQLRNRQLKGLGLLYQPNSLDTPVTGKLKHAFLTQLLQYAADPTAQNLTGCALLNPFLQNREIVHSYLIGDTDPARFTTLKTTLSQLNLECLRDAILVKYQHASEPWQEYLNFLQAHSNQFTQNPNTSQILSTFGIETRSLNGTKVYGSYASALTSIDQYFAVIALETFAKIGQYTFPPSRGYQELENARQNGTYPTDYVVYAHPPQSVNWVPNQQDYTREQPGRGEYIGYLLAHADETNSELLTSQYDLPLSHMTHRFVIVTDRDFLEQRKTLLQQQITQFEDYALPSTSQSMHNWKVQTVGPVVPGSRPGLLSAEDTWRGECRHDPTAERYEYRFNGVTYCLDVGGLHERGHLIMHMLDLHFRSNSRDYFWNYDPASAEARAKCQQFAQLSQTSPLLLATGMVSPSLSTYSIANKYTLFDWEHNYFETANPLYIDHTLHDTGSRVRFHVTASSANQKFVTATLRAINQSGQVVGLVSVAPTLPQSEVVVEIPTWKLHSSENTYLLLDATIAGQAQPESVLLPSYLVEHLELLRGRTNAFMAEYDIPITFNTQFRPPVANLPSPHCDTAAAIYQSQVTYHEHFLAITSGINANQQAINDQVRPYVLVKLPLDISYAFSYVEPPQPNPVFPSTWTGPMPSLPVQPTPTPGAPTATPTSGPPATATPTPRVTATPTPSPSIRVTSTPTPTPPLPTATPTPSPLPTLTATPRPTATPTSGPQVTNTPTPTRPAPTATPTSSPSPNPTVCNVNPDFNASGTIDLIDVSILFNHLFDEGANIPTDLNCDGVVDLRDFSLLVPRLSL